MPARRVAGVLPAALAALAGLAAAAGATGAGPAAGAAGRGPGSADPLRVVVRAASTSALPPDPRSAHRAAVAVRAAGGRVVAVQASLGTVVADLPPADVATTVAQVAASPAVAAVTPDRALRAASLGTDAAGRPGSMALVADVVGARALWRRGITGDGVGVALVDTGVAPVAGLSGADQVVVGPDLSFESQNRSLRHLDTFGHGTHLAGIIAGREGPRASGETYAAATDRFLGIAPDATLVSLKLADRYGAVDVSQVIAAIDWVVQHRDDTGVRIRVLNLSFGTPSRQAPWQDPLAFAAEVATRYGITVVAAAGNNGRDGLGLNDPAYHRNVIAVGASDPRGTASTADDQVTAFSARRGGAAWWRSPDVVAPGTGIVSLRVPGSWVSDRNPKARVGRAGLRGSGTSQSAAVVSGVAALLLQQRPWLRPEQVRWLLTESARPLPGEPADGAGAGSVDAGRAARTWWVGSAVTTTGSGRGSLEGARGGIHVSDGEVELVGERDVMLAPWSPFTAQVTAAGRMWSWGGFWNGRPWTGAGFARAAGSAGWSGRTWTGRTWGDRAWGGRTWSGRTWTGRTWTDATWDAATGGWVATSWPQPQENDELAATRWGTYGWGGG